MEKDKRNHNDTNKGNETIARPKENAQSHNQRYTDIIEIRIRQKPKKNDKKG